MHLNTFLVLTLFINFDIESLIENTRNICMPYQLYNGLCHYAPSKENWTSLLIAPPPPPIKIGACLVPPLTVLFFCRLIMCYLKIFPLTFKAVLHVKFQDLVNAQPYQTQLGQHSTVNIVELCSYI